MDQPIKIWTDFPFITAVPHPFLFQQCFLTFLWLGRGGGGGDSNPFENNIIVELGQQNLPHTCISLKTQLMPNLVVKALKSMMPLWCHHCFFYNCIKGLVYVYKSSIVSWWKCWQCFYLTSLDAGNFVHYIFKE